VVNSTFNIYNLNSIFTIFFQALDCSCRYFPEPNPAHVLFRYRTHHGRPTNYSITSPPLDPRYMPSFTCSCHLNPHPLHLPRRTCIKPMVATHLARPLQHSWPYRYHYDLLYSFHRRHCIYWFGCGWEQDWWEGKQ